MVTSACALQEEEAGEHGGGGGDDEDDIYGGGDECDSVYGREKDADHDDKGWVDDNGTKKNVMKARPENTKQK